MCNRLLIASLVFALVVPISFADIRGVAPGDSLPAFELDDQNGNTGAIDEGTRLLMFSRDMKANKVAKKAFMERPSSYLPDHHSAYVIDVSGMPKFDTRNFAIPKMQKYPYRIFLDRDASLTTKLPSRKKKITVLHLDKLKVTAIDYVDNPDALTQAVESNGTKAD